jgi:DNA-binding GntR family transcriptional regulator
MAAIQSRLSADEEHMEYSYAQHAELLQLVEEKRDQAAIELLDRHIRHKGESFWKAAEEQFAAVQSDLRATNDER